jgi:hypothetical protein
MRYYPAAILVLLWINQTAYAQQAGPILIAQPEAFRTLVNPNCSHCIDEAKRRAEQFRPDDPVLCWTRGYSDGGAIPIRFFLNPYRVISDSYGVFVYDPEAGYARAFAPSYQFSFYGWRNGVMVMKHKDGTLYSCLTGEAFDGPRKGERLTIIPTLASTWGEWLKRYPHAVAYHMFDKYQPVELPKEEHPDSVRSRFSTTDPHLGFHELVVGVRVNGKARAYPLTQEFQLLHDTLAGEPILVIRQNSTAAAYRPVAKQPRKFKAPHPNQEGVSPPDEGEILPPGAKLQQARTVTLNNSNGHITDQETGSTWDVAGRATLGELKDWTLEPLDSVVCKWFAWSAEYPQTEVYAQEPTKPDGTTKANASETIKAVAGTAEFLRILPKPWATVKAVNPKAHTIALLLDGEKISRVWPIEPDAEVKVAGWWGRLEQFQPGQRVWCWLKLDRKKNPTSVCMLADEMSEFDFHGSLAETKSAPPWSPDEIEKKRLAQQDWLRQVWQRYGLPGTLTFHHIFSGELELMLDHEAIRWGRSLATGNVVHLVAEPPIKGVVKTVTPWRDRTLVRLVVGELQSSELKLGQRLGLRMTPLSANIDQSAYPPDIGRARSPDERIEWFLASTYCACGIQKDICTGQVYTLASCNPNGCGSPDATRKEIRKFITQGKTDQEIWDTLFKDRGPLMIKPHLLP